jgi:hypothetical protein
MESNLTDVSEYVLGLKEIEHLFPDVVKVESPIVEEIDPKKKQINDLLNKISSETTDNQ